MAKGREKQLLKNTGILAIGKLCTQFISFFLLPLYTAFLSTSDFGIVDLLNNYIALFIPLFFFQIDQAIFRFLIDARDNLKKQAELISTSFCVIFIQTVIFVILFCIASPFIKNDFKFFILTNVIVTCYSGFLLQISRGLGDNLSYSIGSFISGVITVVLNVILITIFHMGAYGMLLASFIANISCILFLVIKKQIYKIFSFKKYKRDIKKILLHYSIPLIPNQLSWWVVNVSDRTIITHFISIGANGIYSAANKFSSICITLFNIFNMTWAESASIHLKDNDSSDFFSNVFNATIKLFVSLCLNIIAFMPFVFKYLITGQSFSTAYYQIPILMIATIFNIIVSLLGSIYVALKKSKEIANTSIISAIINLGINLLLIKYIGLYAASISTLIAYLSMSIYRYIDIQKYVKIKLDRRFVFISLTITIIITTFYYINNKYIHIIAILITILFAYLYNINALKSLTKPIINKVIENKSFKINRNNS